MLATCTTHGITIRVQTQYLPNHSHPVAGKFLFGYHITIENGSPYTVQLLRRHWVITDSNGIIRHVDGDGVVGLQPIIEPGTHHEYASFCNFMTEMGKMCGKYGMVRQADGEAFDVEIPEFQMVAPTKLN